MIKTGEYSAWLEIYVASRRGKSWWLELREWELSDNVEERER